MDDKIEELKKKKEKIEKGGGEEKIKKQHDRGKYTARERLEMLLDEGSFQEIGKFVEHRSQKLGMDERDVPGEGVVTGRGTINGRNIYLYAQDFTAMGGSLGEMHAKKIWRIMDEAAKAGVPIIGLNDSGGARIQEGVNSLGGYGGIFYRNSVNSGVIPQISGILGPCAGGAVYSPALTDFVFMVDKTSKMFVTGPDVIKSVTGEEVSHEELGGGMTHNRESGVAHFLDDNEEDCFARMRRLISFIPDNNREMPPFQDNSDPLARKSKDLRGIVPEEPQKSYDVRDVIEPVVDEGDFLEVQPHFARNMVVGFARLGGHSVGLVANQPAVKAGCLDIDSSDKAARFIRFCDSFNIPILTFTDVPGYLPGVEQEHGGVIRHGAKLLHAYSEATVPLMNVILRKAYGGAYIAMSSSHMGGDYVYAWPTAEIAVMGPRGAANIIFRQEINNADDPEAARQEKIDEFRDNFANPYQAASLGYVDDVILPEETRPQLIRSLEAIREKREHRPDKKHGNFPV
ncbi:acyl-CoA carboxylase subunit beta [Halarsenatibacter silvermanii]|uniref:Acetyl-CoA carboxylase, carboxyltransferase component n=1 Tax=Halarsenatibacter silvermanii TaxID=321763 RepID=A0A1G9I915_9FIRM|nr:carboxyl transferase domain-containing protein [Halarsenatibacter silvermanii]SDL21719.1 Acetyl-CoA carboxylase, carboxyltransferase component [Halarsenatibacter silvermanii]